MGQVLLGIILAVALLSSSVVFSDLLAEAALRRTLQEATPEEANIWIRVFNDLDDPSITGRASPYQTAVDFVAERVNPRLDRFMADQNLLFETATFFFGGSPHLEQADEVRPRGKIQYMSALADPARTELVAGRGRWPQDQQPADAPLEVVVDETGAKLLRIDVDDEIAVFPATIAEESSSIPVKIVGVFRRTDPTSDFWYGLEKDFSYQDDRWVIVPLFTTERNILQKVGGAYPGIYTNTTWVLNLGREGLRSQDVSQVQRSIRVVRADVVANLEHGSTSVRLHRVLEQYSQELLLARIPLFLMVFLVTGILAYYLSLVAGLTVRSRSPEIAMLKSRGATTYQVGVLVLVEGLLLAVPAVIIGTLLSPLVAKALGGLFFEVQGSLTPTISWPAFLLGVAGALLAVSVLTVSTLVAARQGIVEFRQSGARPATAPFIHRYYLDILMLVVIALVWWQTQRRGSFVVQSLGERELQIDYTLLLGPVLGLLALGLLVLRFFPLAVAILARVLEPVGPAWLVQGLRRVSRDPIVPGSLVVLLMLATSLGVIGSAFSSTLDRSQRDRAMYQVGTDLRILRSTSRGTADSIAPAQVLASQRSVAATAEAHRLNGHLSVEGFVSTRVSALAVDTDNLDQIAWYRPDFAGGQTLSGLVETFTPPGQIWLEDGMALPPDATGLAAWVQPNRPQQLLSLQARLRDSSGQYFDAPLGDLGFRGWQRLETNFASLMEVPSPARRTRFDPVHSNLTPPFTLLAMYITNSTGLGAPGAVFFDGISAITPSGERNLSTFESLHRWEVIQDYTRPGLYALELSESVTRADSAASASFSWAPGGNGLRGIRAGEPEGPIPALVSRDVADTAEAEVGDVITLGMSSYSLPLKVMAVADFFPTLDPKEQPFAVMDRQTFVHYANRHSQRIVSGPNEIWVSLNDSLPDPAPIITALNDAGIGTRDSLLATELVQQRVQQPLTNASWGGLLVLMFLTLVLASASGVVLFSYMDTKERQTEFALLRTLGSSKYQVNGVVWFSLFLVVACGIGLGTCGGQLIGANILPILEIAEDGTRVTPPMVLQTNWLSLLVAYLVLAAVTLGTVVWLAWFTSKMEVQQVLRAGEAAR